MAPARPLKRQKTNEGPIDNKPEALKPEQIPLPPDSHIQVPAPTPDAASKKTSDTDSRRSSWYPSWSRKTASIAVANRDNATSAETASIMSDRSTPRRPSTRSASLAMTLGKGNSTRSLPVNAETSKVNATPEARTPSRTNSMQAEADKGKEVAGKDAQGPSKANEVTSEQIQAVDNGTSAEKKVDTSNMTGSIRWFAWLGKDGPVSEQDNAADAGKSASTVVHNKVDAKPGAGEQASQPPAAASLDQTTTNRTAETTPAEPTANQKRSWLQMLGGESTMLPSRPVPGASTEPTSTRASEQSKNLDVPLQSPTKPESSQGSSIEASPPPPLPGNASKSAGWVFWSREKNPQTETPPNDEPRRGEIAISDTPSQNKPKRTSISMPDEQRPSTKDIKASAPKKADKAGSIKSLERPQTPIEKTIPKAVDSKGTKKIESKNAAATAVEQPSPRPASPAPSKQAQDNLLLPAFHDTLHLHQSPTLMQQLGRLLYYTREPEPELKHLSLVKDPPRIRNALAIGVHGYFPGPMVRTLLGQPTGTSIKFADMAAKSIRKWTNNRGYDCQVKTAALEGEGKITERVELLWKLLLNWIDEIRKTDFQGVPVAVMLVAKLIQFGCVNAARVGICAMAGVSMGPFAEYKSRWISGSAGELFEFSDPNSKVSALYQDAVNTILKAGVRWTLVGSIDDQLVSLESSIFAPITHPHIYRAVSIDSKVHAPGFLSHLVGFVLKLRNLGVQDHGLIRELSSPLAGSLYTGEGHSRIYDDEAVYDMAVSFALETTALLGVEVTKRNVRTTGANPYILPFALRGILEEDLVRSELRQEVDQLLHQFDDWKPSTKALKDVKFRLEGVRSKL
ncbi:uncharacterized protein AB675_10986 [Cyphellophora attinorum]|uniref:YMC020W-like alpha/beta hydrolase domain-containing protein n=1 Tax=Cyphellophora attinorum TaxID=1664694 RepID=A0A0N1NVW7_9EURO|nr:uncharacterized protein AB675_10986 [Phialophora attinorum]KPI35515.1 hypothetical protein AB675_10986 [Phialophora attinorum]